MTSSDDSSESRRGASPTPVWRASLAAGAGSAIEYYDFSLYANMAIFLAPLFFAKGDPTAAMLNTLAIFASGFLMRPVGAIFFGWLGDTRGRKIALLSSILTMGIVSAATGLLPTYADAGLVAPLLLVVVRLVQGFCAGGEASGAATYIAENSPRRLRGFFGAFTPAGIALGTAFAGGVAGICSWILSDQQMQDFGWRIPFLLSFPLAIFCVLLRRALPEEENDRNVERSGENPLKYVLRHERPALIKVILLAFAITCTGYVGHVYLNVHLTSELGHPKALSLNMNSVITVLFAILMPASAYLSDIWGRRRVFGIAMVGYIVLTIPMFKLMESTNVVILGIAMAVSFIPWVFSQAIGYPLVTEVVGGAARYTAVAFGFGIGTIIGGGCGPYIAKWLTAATGWSLAPAAYMSVAALIGALTLLKVGASRIDETPLEKSNA